MGGASLRMHAVVDLPAEVHRLLGVLGQEVEQADSFVACVRIVQHVLAQNAANVVVQLGSFTSVHMHSWVRRGEYPPFIRLL